MPSSARKLLPSLALAALSQIVVSQIVISQTALAQTAGVLDWQQDANPPSRRGFKLVYHAAIDAALMFGGDEQGALQDTWLWQDGWRRVPTTVAPSARTAYAIAYDSARNRTVLFGGYTHPAVWNDTWAFDGAQWTQLSPATSPSGRADSQMVYDAARDRMVLMGGSLSSNGPQTEELWEFDNTQWSLRPQGGVATQPFGNMLVYDAPRAEVLNYVNSSLLAWDGAVWSTRSTAGLPPNALGGQLFYEAAGQRVLLVNPTINYVRTSGIYAWQGQGWSQVGDVQPPASTQLVMVPIGNTTQILGVVPSSLSQSPDRTSSTWQFDGTNWQRIQAGTPVGRSYAAMAYDSQRQRIVLQGGNQGFSTLYETRELDRKEWVLATGGVSGGPLQCVHHGLVYDEQRGVTVLFGGSQQLQSWTDEWNGSSWVFRQVTSSPPGRWYPAMAYDRLRGRTLVFGGQGVQPNLADTWAWNGTAWTDLSPAVSPSPRHAAGLCYDIERDRAVLFGGTDDSMFYDETWEFDGVLWTQLSPLASPGARADHVQVYDATRHQTIVFGGQAGAELRDTWTWDGTTWTELSTAHTPDSGVGVCGAYDSDRRELVVFGGVPSRGEVWRLRDTGLGAWASDSQGCDTGHGNLTLTSADPIAIGAIDRLTLHNLPNHYAVLASLWLGFRDQQWNGTPLPASLESIGSPGCFVRMEPTIPSWFAIQGNGEANLTLSVPNAPVFVDLPIFAQAACWDLLTSHITTSNLLAGRIGVP
jgi:hypothetical protein